MTFTARRVGQPGWLCRCVLLTAIVASPAKAEMLLPNGAGVQLDGALVDLMEIEALAAASEGDGATTTLRAGAVERRRVGGRVTSRTTIDSLILHAEGQDSSSTMAVGTISDVTTGGDLANTVTLGTSTNIAIGAGARACTELGTLGRIGVCD